MKIAFYGDGILDRYVPLVRTKMDPVGIPVYEQRGVAQEYNGGALNAASVLTHFCESLMFAPVLVEMARFHCNGHELYRLDKPRPTGNLDALRRDCVTNLVNARADAIVISDYRKGMVNSESLRTITEHARQRAIPCVIDAKHLYDGVDYAGMVIKCNELESVAVLSQSRGRFTVVVTRASLPPIIHTGEKTAEAPAIAFPPLPFQSCGAGDSFAAFLAYCLPHHSLEESVQRAYLAAAAAGLFPPFRQPVLPREVKAIKDHARLKVLANRTELLEWCRHRAGTETVVTNGCFDLFHAGHAQNLAECRQQGDSLLVLVNSDQSLRWLKGGGRPYVTLDERMRILGGLECVTAVASFDEATPEVVLKECAETMRRKFAVLAKGSDCSSESVPGRQYAERIHITRKYQGRSSEIAARVKAH